MKLGASLEIAFTFHNLHVFYPNIGQNWVSWDSLGWPFVQSILNIVDETFL